MLRDAHADPFDGLIVRIGQEILNRFLGRKPQNDHTLRRSAFKGLTFQFGDNDLCLLLREKRHHGGDVLFAILLRVGDRMGENEVGAH